MDIFAERLRYAMDQAHMNQAALSLQTGIGKPGISQYLAGKNTPKGERISRLAKTLGVSAEFLLGHEAQPAVASIKPGKITTDQAARCMGKSGQFVRVGLQRGILPFGSAILISSKWTYYISPGHFKDYVGTDCFNRFFGLAG